MTPGDQPSDISSIVITSDDDQFGNYYANAVINRAGTYGVMTSLMSLGSLRLVIYKNPDFTNMVEELRIVAQPDEIATKGGFQVTFDSTMATVSQFFETRTN
jgi:hypothetical protein